MFESPKMNNPEKKPEMPIPSEKPPVKHETPEEKEKKEHKEKIALEFKRIDRFISLDNPAARRLAEDEKKRELTPKEKENLLFYRMNEASRLAKETFTRLPKEENNKLSNLWQKDIFIGLTSKEKREYDELKEKYWSESFKGKTRGKLPPRGLH